MIDAFGSDVVDETHRAANTTGEGWIYCAFPNPMTGEDKPKASYVKALDWDGIPALIGAGIYQRDPPGSRGNPPIRACASSCATWPWNWSPRGTLP